MASIDRTGKRFHSKASEEYIDVVFKYPPSLEYGTSIPIKYRRTGTEIEENDIDAYLSKVYAEVAPSKWNKWKADQKKFWSDKPGAAITKSFFDALAKKFEWCCVSCELPKNPNWARRIQDIKEFGYTLATHTSRPCRKCREKTTQLILVPIKRGGITGYETWSPALRDRIVDILKAYDVYEAKVTRKEGLLPDHKFPEIRWDTETRRETLESLSDSELQRDFQLLSNQRNQQKREVCRTCFQTGKRGLLFGIFFYYRGTENWDESIPKVGKDAEAGCVGCGWYDFEKWRSEIIKKCNQ